MSPAPTLLLGTALASGVLASGALASGPLASGPLASGALAPAALPPDLPFRLPSPTALSFHPTLAASDGAVVLLWHGFIADRVSRLYAMAADGADLGELAAGRDAVDPRVIAASDGALHVVYRAGDRPGDRPGDRAGDRHGDIYWTERRDHRWSASRNLSLSSGDSRYPDIVADGETLTVVWEEVVGGAVQLWFTRSSDGGRTWIRARDTGLVHRFPGFLGHHRLATDGSGGLSLAWQDGETTVTDIFHSRLRDGRWTPEDNVSQSAEEFSGEPAIAVVGGALQLVWVEQDHEDGRVFHLARAESDGDRGWRRLPVVAAGAGILFRPQLIGDRASASLLYEQQVQGQRQLMVSRLPFRHAERIQGAFRDPRRAQAVYDPAGVLHLAFDAESRPGQRAIYYRRLD